MKSNFLKEKLLEYEFQWWKSINHQQIQDFRVSACLRCVPEVVVPPLGACVHQIVTNDHHLWSLHNVPTINKIFLLLLLL